MLISINQENLVCSCRDNTPLRHLVLASYLIVPDYFCHGEFFVHFQFQILKYFHLSD